jgi:hypothetical protein
MKTELDDAKQDQEIVQKPAKQSNAVSQQDAKDGMEPAHKKEQDVTIANHSVAIAVDKKE